MDCCSHYFSLFLYLIRLRCLLSNTWPERNNRFVFFCRATRMHSTTMTWQGVCPSVCHTPVVCRKGWTYDQSFFHRRVARPFQFFHTERNGYTPTETPLTGVPNARGYGKVTIFDPYLALSREWCNIGSVHRPLLFLLYTAELFDIIVSHGPSAHFYTPTTGSCMSTRWRPTRTTQSTAFRLVWQLMSSGWRATDCG